MRYCILSALMLMSGVGLAQSYKPVSVRIGLGALSGSYNGGSLLQIEPSYRLTDKLSMGFRIEGLTGALKGQSILQMKSFGMSAQRYFLPGEIRLFAGIGGALYSPQLVAGGRCDCTYGTSSAIPGIYPRIGLDYRHLFLNLEYNFISSTQVDIYDRSIGTNSSEGIDVSYLSFKVGIAIGGGLRKK
jgi:hypothetical protein